MKRYPNGLSARLGVLIVSIVNTNEKVAALDPASHLLRWSSSQGAKGHLQVTNKNGVRGLAPSGLLPAGASLLSVPRSFLLKPMRSEVLSAGVKAEVFDTADEKAKLALTLLVESRKFEVDQRWPKPFLDCLPLDEDFAGVGARWSDSELEWLEGADIRRRVMIAREVNQKLAESISDAVIAFYFKRNY